MKLISSLVLTLAAGVAMLAAAPAMARVDVDINLGVPGYYAAPAPYGPPPRYLAPPPVYYQPGPVYVQPGPVYVQPRPVYPEDWRERDWHHRHDGRRWDRDGDGVPNRHDRRPHDPRRY